MQVLKGHTGPVWCLALSHSGTTFASGSGTARLWKVDSFEQLLVLPGERNEVIALDFSTDDQRLFTGSADGKQLKPRSNEDES